MPQFLQTNQIASLKSIVDRDPRITSCRFIPLDRRQDDSESGFTLLHRAVQVNNLEATKYLLQISKIEINHKSDRGWTPLLVAIRYGDLNMVRFLVENGADVNAKTQEIRPYNPGGSISGSKIKNLTPLVPSQTPKEIALEYKRSEIIDFLSSLEK